MPRFFASCPKGVEGLLLDELLSFGFSQPKATDAGVAWEGKIEEGYRACLWSRLASRIFLELQRFPADSPDDVYEGALSVDWIDHLDTNGTFSVDASLRASTISHSHYAALRVKDAIVDYFRDRSGDRPNVDKFNPDLRVNLHVRGREGILSLDFSGRPLHERGYRDGAGLAPLKENLASAILYRLDWPRLAGEGAPLFDPMCGSGTFLIEGAMIAQKIAPGTARLHWGFSGWKNYDRNLWRNLQREARELRVEPTQEINFRGADHDPRIVDYARENATRAGLSKSILFAKCELRDIKENPFGNKSGLLVTNPPYGERMGEAAALTETYADLGSLIRNYFQGWSAGVFTGNPSLGKVMGLRATRTHGLPNGSIPCQILRFDVKAERFVAAREGHSVDLGKQTVALSQGASALQNRLVKNFRQFSKWAEKEGIECYRVYDADIPEHNVAIDLYGDALVIQEYAAPQEIPEAVARGRLEEVLLVAPSALGISRDRVFLKTRARQRGSDQYQRREVEEVISEVREQGHKFLVNFTNYLDTGLFLDHRITRKMIEERARGKAFLNLFAYTGTATVYAAAGGAKSTLTVDLSRTYLEWAERNMRLNGFEGPAHRYIEADCRDWLGRNTREKFDLIFIDPPTFSNSKKIRKPFQVQADYLYLLERAALLLNPGGEIIFSNNFRQFKMETSELEKLGLGAVDLGRQTIPLDFRRNARIHRAWLVSPRRIGEIVADNPHERRHKEKPKKITHD
jgi:23S rRNA (guanine2445-N2)-methyltransferase / 23S rRNA (guanine2069-N7)-methyltransferase